MSIQFGPIAVKINAFLIIMGFSLYILHELAHNEELKAKLKQMAEEKKQTQQADKVIANFFQQGPQAKH